MLLIRPGDARIVYAPLRDMHAWLDDRLRDLDETGELRPASGPLNPAAFVHAYNLIHERIGELSRAEAADRLDDPIWALIDSYIAFTAEALKDVGPDVAARLVAAQTRVQMELARLGLYRLADRTFHAIPETAA